MSKSNIISNYKDEYIHNKFERNPRPITKPCPWCNSYECIGATNSTIARYAKSCQTAIDIENNRRSLGSRKSSKSGNGKRKSGRKSGSKSGRKSGRKSGKGKRRANSRK